MWTRAKAGKQQKLPSFSSVQMAQVSWPEGSDIKIQTEYERSIVIIQVGTHEKLTFWL